MFIYYLNNEEVFIYGIRPQVTQAYCMWFQDVKVTNMNIRKAEYVHQLEQYKPKFTRYEIYPRPLVLNHYWVHWRRYYLNTIVRAAKVSKFFCVGARGPPFFHCRVVVSLITSGHTAGFNEWKSVIILMDTGIDFVARKFGLCYIRLYTYFCLKPWNLTEYARATCQLASYITTPCGLMR